MGKIIISDIKRALSSKRFWISAGLIIICTAINLLASSAYDLNKRVGWIGLFIFGNIIGNPMIYLLEPFIPAFIFAPLFMEDIKSGAYKDVSKKTGLKKYLAARSVSSLIAGSGIFIISLLIILAGCFFCDPTVQTIEYMPIGLFKEVYYSSALLYIILFILYTALCGALFCFLSFGIGLASNSSSMSLVLPGIIGSCSYLMLNLFNNPVLSWMQVLLPYLVYAFDVGTPPLNRMAKLCFILFASLILVAAGYHKLKKESRVNTAATGETHANKIEV